MELGMTRREREDFLAGVHVGVLSIPEPGRGPLSAPVWYDYEPGGPIELVTGRDSRKGRLLAKGVRVAFVAQSEAPPYRYVSVEGPVVSLAPCADDAVERRLARRYLGREGAEAYLAATAARRESEPNVLVRIRPERWLSVDYGKAFPSAGDVAARLR